VAQAEARPLDWRALEERLRQPAIARELGRVGIREAADLLARRLSGPAGVRRLGGPAPRNTDDNARLEFAAPRDLVNYRRFSSRRILSELGSGLPDPLAGVERLPADAAARLCRGLLRAGRPRVASRLKDAPASCTELARRLQQTPPRPDRDEALRRLGADPRAAALRAALDRPPLVAADLVAGLLVPERDARLGFWLIGRLLAAAEDEHRAIQLLLAARALGEQGPELRESLARVLFLRQQFGQALELLSR